MTYPYEHLLVTWHWTTFDDEQGQVGLRFNTPGLPSAAEMDGVQAASTAFWSGAGAAISVDFKLDRIKAARVGVDGKYPPGSIPVVRDFAGVGGAGAAPIFPLQVAAVLSLEGFAPRAPAGRGRIYLPPLNSTMSATKWTSGAVGGRLTAAGIWINAVGDALGAPAYILSAKGAGAGQVITKIRHGNRPDVQRRRAAQQPEVYQEAAL